MKKIYLLFFITLLFPFSKSAYSQINCASDILHEKMLKNDPAYAHRYHELEHRIYWNALEKIQSGRNDKALRTTQASYNIPVVVHIIHNGGPENILDADVLTRENLASGQYFVQLTQDSKGDCNEKDINHRLTSGYANSL